MYIQTQGYWLNDTHWVEYESSEADPSPSKRRRREEPQPHKTGSARTEGYYKLDSKEKAKHKSHFARTVTDDSRAAETFTVLLQNLYMNISFLCFNISTLACFLVFHTICWCCRYDEQDADAVERSPFQPEKTVDGVRSGERFRSAQIQPIEGNFVEAATHFETQRKKK